MTSSPSTPPQPNLTDAIIAQMSIGPAYREVAAALLRDKLQELYPTLKLDPNTVVVGTPLWDIDEDQIVPVGRDYQVLTNVLAVQALVAVPALYIEGHHFLSQLPIIEPAVHLPVRILDIASALNTLAPVMLRAYQQAQLDYWNGSEKDSGPRWHALSAKLRNFWNISQVPGLTESDCLMARQLFLTPDAATRKLTGPDAPRAYVIDIDQIDAAGKVTHVDDYLISVLIGKQQGTEVILTQSLFSGFKKYQSLGELSQDLPQLSTHKKKQWRLIEPAGDFFDYLSSAFISIQINDIGAISFSDLREPDASHHNLAQPPTPRAKRSAPPLQDYIQALPDWLTNASVPDQDAYSRHLKDLATLHSANEGRSYDDGISPLQSYPLEQLKAEILKDHPDANTDLLDDLTIVVRSLVVWGLFVVPGKFDTTAFSLTELALQNLIALPLGDKTLRTHNQDALPQWLTVAYLESLITRVDIGNAYPALVKKVLLDDAQEATRRQRLYAEHLRIQLPLLALQCKICDEGGIDEQGYAYVRAVMQVEPGNRHVQGQPIVMRPLAFVPERRADSTPDEVANMFVIGPKDPAAGPCVLYRPQLDKPLSQYPSPNNLLYALQQSVSLRESVLAWLPDNVRDDYARYVFPGALPSPWTVVDFMVDPFKVWTMSGPLQISQTPVDGELFTALYNANANAMVALADRQSVSNAEARWETFKRAGWLAFSLALPFLGRTVGIAAWIWQIMDDLQQVTDAQNHPEQDSPWAALADLLLNIGMAITLHSVSRNAPRRELPSKALPPPELPTLPKSVAISQLATISSDTLVATDQPLHVSGAINRTPLRLATVLDSFKVNKPDTLGDANTEVGPWQDLYRGGQHWYAPVGDRWFQVTVDENETVVIVDPQRSSRIGPTLIHNNRGQWFIDTRLRLRGGGPTVLTAKAKALARQKAEELRRKLEAFELQKKTNQKTLQEARDAMGTDPSTSTQAAHQAYLQTLQTQRTEYEAALQMLKEMHVHEPIPEYPSKAQGYIRAQAKLTQATLDDIAARFTPKWNSVCEQTQHQRQTPQERRIEDFREVRELAKTMLVQQEYMDDRFAQLNNLGKDGVYTVLTLKQFKTVYSVDALKAIRVSLGRNLCLPEGTLRTESAAWSAIDHIFDKADVAIQCLTDTLKQGSTSRLDERIETLSDLIERFQLLDERLRDFHEEFSKHAISGQLLELREELRDFKKRAAINLITLSGERTLLRSQPTPPPSPPHPMMQFIRTRYDGALIGEARLNESDLQTGMLDVRSTLTGKILATFHEKPKGVWVAHYETPLPPVEPVELVVQETVYQGKALIDGMQAFRNRASAHAKHADRVPLGIEYLYHQQIQRLREAGNAIDQALTQHNITESNDEFPPASTVRNGLRDAADQLNQESNQLVREAFKASPPTITGVEWLKHQNAIIIEKTKNRQKTKQKTFKYLDEYTISERASSKALWYAHFHYSSRNAYDRLFLSARLKTPLERDLDTADSPAGLNSAQTVAFYRSEISRQQAIDLFFKRPKSESGS